MGVCSCPEEWVLGTALRMAGLDETGFIDWPMTDQVTHTWK
jgi:hypothetical protein